jgi:hypothetical protein
MKSFIIRNAEEILFATLVFALTTAVTYNALTYGIINTGSFEF